MAAPVPRRREAPQGVPIEPAGDAAPQGASAAGPALAAFAAVAIAWALGYSDGTFSVLSLVLVTLATAATISAGHLGRGLVTARGTVRKWAAAILAAGLAWSLFYDAVLPPGFDVAPGTLGTVRPLLAVVGIAVLGYAWRGAPKIVRGLRFPIALLAATAIYGIVIRASPRPHIDVWIFQQLGSYAVTHGMNPYLVAYPNIYGPNTPSYSPAVLSPDQAYVLGNPYPPLTLLLAVPAALLGTDARWTLLLCVVFSAWAIRRLGRGSALAELAAVFLLIQPRGFFVVERAWTEPTILATTLLAMLAVDAWWRRRAEGSVGEPRARLWIGAGLAAALALASKQYAVLVLLPLLFATPARGRWKAALVAVVGAAAITAPFALWDLRAFFRSIVSFQLEQPFRYDALSWPALVAGYGGPVLPIWPAFLLAAGYLALALRRGVALATTPIVGGAAWLLLVLFNKQAFCNYYWLAVGLLCAGLAWMGVEQSISAKAAPDAEARGDEPRAQRASRNT